MLEYRLRTKDIHPKAAKDWEGEEGALEVLLEDDESQRSGTEET